MRKIAVVESFFTPAHVEKIRSAAERLGFSVDFYPDCVCPENQAGAYEVVYGLCPPETLKYYTDMKWFCCSFAGVDTYAREGVFPNEDTILSNSSGAYGVTISEHLLMVTLMLLRRMPEFESLVRQRGWQRSLPMRSICGSRFTVMGTGDIGTNFARRVKALGAKEVIGVRRTQRSADPAFDRIVTFNKLDEVLPETEILVMALPGTPETIGILSRQRIALLPENAYVINVGRGTAVDQDALCQALNNERIAGAALDVTMPEPLPQDSPLWDAKNLIITPHCSGNYSLGITCDLNVDLFLEDLENYAAGRPLNRLVNRKLGY